MRTDLPLLPRVGLTVLFIVSAWPKIMEPEAFVAAVQGYQLLPAGWVVPAAALIPWLELWCAVALWITPVFRHAAWTWILLLLLVFTAAKISVLQRGLGVSCGCSGSGDPLTWMGVWTNLIWLGVALAGWKWDRRG